MPSVVLLSITLLGYAQLFADREAIAEFERKVKGQQDSEGSKKKASSVSFYTGSMSNIP
jgi:hypothetical protein